VRLCGFRLSVAADRQLTQIFWDSENRFGSDARARYEALIARAIRDLLEDPQRPGTKVIKGLIHYHLRHSKSRSAGRVGSPRHLIVARIIGDRLQVLTVVYDAMVEGLNRNRGGRRGLTKKASPSSGAALHHPGRRPLPEGLGHLRQPNPHGVAEQLHLIQVNGGISPNPRKFRHVKFSPATIASRSITCPLSRKV